MADRVTKVLLPTIALLLLALLARPWLTLPPAQAQTPPAGPTPLAQMVVAGNSVCVLRGDQLYLYSVVGLPGMIAGAPRHMHLTLEDTRVVGARP